MAEETIAFLTRLSPEHLSILLEGKMLDAKLEILKEIGALKLRSKSRKEEFSKIIGELRHTNGDRKIVVHGVWHPRGGYRLADLEDWDNLPPRPADATLHRPRGKTVKMQAEQLAAIAKRMEIEYQKLFTFVKRVWLDPYIARAVRRIEKSTTP